MINAAAQTQAGRDSAAALVRAYMGMRTELIDSLESDQTMELSEEFQRLFPPLDEPESFSPAVSDESDARLRAVAEEGRTRLAQLSGWIQGFIDEVTFQQRMRFEGEAMAREQAKPGTGFGR